MNKNKLHLFRIEHYNSSSSFSNTSENVLRAREERDLKRLDGMLEEFRVTRRMMRGEHDKLGLMLAWKRYMERDNNERRGIWRERQ